MSNTAGGDSRKGGKDWIFPAMLIGCVVGFFVVATILVVGGVRASDEREAEQAERAARQEAERAKDIEAKRKADAALKAMLDDPRVAVMDGLQRGRDVETMCGTLPANLARSVSRPRCEGAAGRCFDAARVVYARQVTRCAVDDDACADAAGKAKADSIGACWLKALNSFGENP